MYKKIGKIENFEDIPWGKEIIITGSVDGNRAWLYRMRGTFKKDDCNYRFVNEFGMPTHFNKQDKFSLNILQHEQANRAEEREG